MQSRCRAKMAYIRQSGQILAMAFREKSLTRLIRSVFSQERRWYQGLDRTRQEKDEPTSQRPLREFGKTPEGLVKYQSLWPPPDLHPPCPDTPAQRARGLAPKVLLPSLVAPGGGQDAVTHHVPECDIIRISHLYSIPSSRVGRRTAGVRCIWPLPGATAGGQRGLGATDPPRWGVGATNPPQRGMGTTDPPAPRRCPL